MKKVGLYMLLTVVSLAFAACAGQGTSPTSGIYPERAHQLIAKHSGKCLDVSGVSTANGANIIQYDCHGGSNQQWTLTNKGDGYYLAVAKHSGKCLDVSGVSTANGTNIIQYDCHGGSNQQWKLIPKGQGYYMLTAKHSGKCLDVAGASMANGVNIIQYDCHGGPNQLWKLK
ncbi:MAG: RICIN domain-containing protein [Syntrophaceae bacterium]